MATNLDTAERMGFSALLQTITLAAVTMSVYITLRSKIGQFFPTSNPRARSLLHESLTADNAMIDPQQPRTVHVRPVDPDQSQADADIDIIAIHGLDTKSPDTWTWRDPRNPESIGVNWLADRRMLPEAAGNACIFTCDWPAKVYESLEFEPSRMEELARDLLAGIQGRHSSSIVKEGAKERPIFFIASCLGGLILAKALTMASGEYKSLQKATRGIVFLATPFRGTSFADIASWVESCLRIAGFVQERRLTQLLANLKESTFDLIELRRKFTACCKELEIQREVFTFYEHGKTNLLRGRVPWISQLLNTSKVLVSQDSATLDFVQHPLQLKRRHVLMNKFRDPDDDAYQRVSSKIQEILIAIRKGTPIARADAAIRTERYSKVNLQIERLSGEFLSMEKCYINLAIIKQSHNDGSRLRKDPGTAPTPFSLTSRLNIERQMGAMVIALPKLFDKRQTGTDQEMQPRRILIRGRAGVGKTTLCKKIVHDFTYPQNSAHGGMWSNMFDRILWIPLRKLKQQKSKAADYNFGQLFQKVLFAQNPEKDRHAEALWKEVIDTQSARTLFLLDGWDEVAYDLDYMSEFLQVLLNQQHIIITSRPHARLPEYAHAVDLELETIGFNPTQVASYLEMSMGSKAEQVDSFLSKHRLMQDLVRIPIQLDALCYIWNSAASSLQSTPETMTAVYTAIHDKLWTKDLATIKKDGRTPYSETRARDAQKSDIEHWAWGELFLLEALAFTGMCNNLVDLEEKSRSAVFERFQIREAVDSPHEALKSLSFVRTSDPLLSPQEQQYHFIHLTFQEYFAARYFVRQWEGPQRKGPQPLLCLVFEHGECKDEELHPATFLQKHKYDTRFDIFWRFVAGLIGTKLSKQTVHFFEMIEAEPRDVLGPAHQRLVMHCLGEVPPGGQPEGFTKLREGLEDYLSQWLRFECEFTKASQLVRESDIPETSLKTALKQANQTTKAVLLRSLQHVPRIPLCVLDLSAPWIAGHGSVHRILDILDLLKRVGKPVFSKMVKAVAGLLEHENSGVRQSAINALGQQPNLSEAVLQAVIQRLEDENSGVRWAAIYTLRKQPSLSEAVLQAVVRKFEHEDSTVRLTVIPALGKQPSLSEAVLQVISKNLKQVVLDTAEYHRSENHRSGYHRSVYDRFAYHRFAYNPSVVFVSLLRHNPQLIFLSEASGTFGHLFHFLLQQSFKSHLAWYYNAEIIYLAIGGIIVEHKAQIPSSALDRALDRARNVRSIPILAINS